MLDAWEKDHAYGMWETYHQRMLEFVQNDLLLDEYRKLCENAQQSSNSQVDALLFEPSL